MRTTGADAGTAAVALTEAELDRYVTHAPTRGLLATAGAPADTGPLTFSPLRAHGLRTCAEATEGPLRLAEELRDRLVMGELLSPAGTRRGAAGRESILLDGATGEISTAYLHRGSAPRPFAPSLTTLLRFAAATEELAGLRGRFASLAGQYGVATATEASRRLLALFEEGTDGVLPPYWKATALIRPLSLLAGPGTANGLTLEVPTRVLEQEFGPGRMARFDEVDFPPTLTHEPTRRFLRDAGLPEQASVFHADTDIPLPTLTEYAEEESLSGLPAHADHLIRVGALAEAHSLLLDGRTGAVLTYADDDGALHPLNTDLSTLTFTLWLLHHEHTINTHLDGELTATAHDHLAAVMRETLGAVDGTGSEPGPGVSASSSASADWHYWTSLLENEASGVL
ncbi:SUKH-4 family immunity protein [Streptomyces sp. J2-1]|uniref:SUKH-4 family immunity protein n=1 Tax=Streptomyces corallincola TaxID=2851888 RepID=UPI001C37EF5A|nr:SUKH-4 family immunity protein [Streptomyces corallincola]MBV2354370.1 SUKH-4 family immunity protein [Streptomyces corallincola]